MGQVAPPTTKSCVPVASNAVGAYFPICPHFNALLGDRHRPDDPRERLTRACVILGQRVGQVQQIATIAPEPPHQGTPMRSCSGDARIAPVTSNVKPLHPRFGDQRFDNYQRWRVQAETRAIAPAISALSAGDPARLWLLHVQTVKSKEVRQRAEAPTGTCRRERHMRLLEKPRAGYQS